MAVKFEDLEKLRLKDVIGAAVQYTGITNRRRCGWVHAIYRRYLVVRRRAWPNELERVYFCNVQKMGGAQ